MVRVRFFTCELKLPVFRVRKLDDLKKIVKEHSPDIIFYWKEPHPLRRPPIGLRLTFHHKMDTYVFIDFANKTMLQKTGITVYASDKGEEHIKDKDINHFITTQLQNAKAVSMGCFSID